MRRFSLHLLATALLCPAATARGADNVLEEIVVTAQHRLQSARSTPISLFTMNAEQLEKQRITNITNLNGLVPNLTIDSFPANNQTLRLFIRGVGLTDTQVTQDAAVGVYLNGAYIARSTGLAFDVADLERIEILRGPQGTLYGRNTTGGAIKLISRKPDTQKFAFDQTLSAGNNDLLRSKTSANVPLGESYAMKLAYFYEDVDGFTDNNGPGGSWGDRKSEGLRLDLRAEVNAALSMDYGFDSSRIEYFNLPTQAVMPRASGSGLLSIVGDIARDYVPYDNNRINTLNTTVPLQPTDTTIDGHTLNIEWQVSSTTTLRSITAFRELADKSYIDFASGSAQGFRLDFNGAVIGANAGEARMDVPLVRPDLEQEQFSQEFQLLGSAGESLDYIAGLYYFTEEAKENITPTRHIFSVSPFADGTLYNIGTEYNEIDNQAWAFFSQATWTPQILHQRLHLTLGWRHSEDEREALRRVEDEVVIDQGNAVVTLLPPSFFAVDTGDTYDDDSFAFIAQYDWNEDINLYAKLAEAYKSGGFNIRDPDETGFSNGFEEEKLRSVEAGFKGDFLQRMLQLNMAVFYQEFEDFQYNFQIPGTIQGTRVFNIDNGDMSGVELEVMAMPANGLFLHFTYAYTDSNLDDVLNPFTGELQAADFGNAPEHTYSLVVDYTRPLGDFGLFNINTSYNFVDDREQHSPTNFRPDYSLWHGRISISEFKALGGVWSMALWGKNLQDSDYEAFTLDNLPQAERAVIWGDGRSYGLDISYHYE